MKPCRVHILGASGSGTTTLGRALANRWSVPHADADDYFWVPTSPPYTTSRDPEARLRLMGTMFLPRDAWVLSGSLVGWGDPLTDQFDLVVLLTLTPETRLARLRAREVTRYGPRVDHGGDLADAHRTFMDWAAGYDDDAFAGRSRAGHEVWVRRLRCPVLRLDSSDPVEDLVARIVGADGVPSVPGHS